MGQPLSLLSASLAYPYWPLVCVRSAPTSDLSYSGSIMHAGSWITGIAPGFPSEWRSLTGEEEGGPDREGDAGNPGDDHSRAVPGLLVFPDTAPTDAVIVVEILRVRRQVLFSARGYQGGQVCRRTGV